MPIQAARPDPSAALAGLGAPPASGNRASSTASRAPGAGFAALMKQAQAQTQPPSSLPTQSRQTDCASHAAEPAHAAGREAAPDRAAAGKTGNAKADEATQGTEAFPGDARRVRAKAAPKPGAGADKPKPNDATVAHLPAALKPSDEAGVADLSGAALEVEALRQAKDAQPEQPAAQAPLPAAALTTGARPKALSAQQLEPGTQPPAEAAALGEALGRPGKATAKALAAKADPQAADAAQTPATPAAMAALPASPEWSSALRSASSSAARTDALQSTANPRSLEGGLSALAWAAGPAPGVQSLAAAEQAASATLTPPPGHPDFADALTTQVAVWVGKGVQEAQLQLNPKDMGPVQVWIALDNASAQVRFAAEHSATREALQAALPELAQALARDGIQLGGASVQTSDPGGFAQARQQGDGPQGGRRAFLSPEAAGAGPTPARTIGRPGTNLLDLYA